MPWLQREHRGGLRGARLRWSAAGRKAPVSVPGLFFVCRSPALNLNRQLGTIGNAKRYGRLTLTEGDHGGWISVSLGSTRTRQSGGGTGRRRDQTIGEWKTGSIDDSGGGRRSSHSLVGLRFSSRMRIPRFGGGDR